MSLKSPDQEGGTNLCSSFPVVAVIATSGKDRVKLLLERALPSVAKQTHPVDLVLIISDDDDYPDGLADHTVKFCFQPNDQGKVHLLKNKRTKHHSGTGPWNTGIREAFTQFEYGEDCWIAILDDDDEWKPNHVEDCMKTAADSGGDRCQWVASGIKRKSNRGGGEFRDSTEDIFQCLDGNDRPSPKQFFASNPGIQGSNLFVKCGLLLRAGMFDENLRSTTDRDLSIRLCDVLDANETFGSTGEITVVHYADFHNLTRVSTPGSKGKRDGLIKFYSKHTTRMTETGREQFKERARERFECDVDDFEPETNAPQSKSSVLNSWSGKPLTLHAGTAEALPKLPPLKVGQDKKNVLFGIISGNFSRLKPLLDDLHAASVSTESDFRAFVVVFLNSKDQKLSRKVTSTLAEKNLGRVIQGSDPIVLEVLVQCQSWSSASSMEPSLPLPICQARTVLQVYLYHATKELDNVSAVCILDDDKRLPFGWSPLRALDNHLPADIQIGRDLRTPPNPTLMSIQTQLVDLIYSLDLLHITEDEDERVRQFCYPSPCIDNKFDWYYDFSSSRSDHLECPVPFDIRKLLKSAEGDMRKVLQICLGMMLVGTPLSRDVIPPSETETTTQRGGCMVILKKKPNSFDVLAMEQVVPRIAVSGQKGVCTRRSDSLWCQVVKAKDNSKTIEVNPSLYVYHDNTLDKVPTPAEMRRTMVLEICGAVLCRGKTERATFARKRILDLKCWLLRVQALLKSLRSRRYYNETMEQTLIQPLMNIFNPQEWEEEVYKQVDEALDTIIGFESKPTDFSTIPEVALDVVTTDLQEWISFTSDDTSHSRSGLEPNQEAESPVNSGDSSSSMATTKESPNSVCAECCGFCRDQMCEQCSASTSNTEHSTTESSNIEDQHKSELKFHKTELPVRVERDSMMMTTFYCSKTISEGGLDITIAATVKSDNIEGAENVHVRIHSECLTGDVFRSLKCDCGIQKDTFLDKIMPAQDHAVFIYIKGHEGRGAGLANKTRAYFHLDTNEELTHVDALEAVGCKSDIRKYDAAVRFLRDELKIKSICLYTNNPAKLKACQSHFPNGRCATKNMPAIPNEHNLRYLQEKEELCDHRGLLKEEDDNSSYHKTAGKWLLATGISFVFVGFFCHQKVFR